MSKVELITVVAAIWGNPGRSVVEMSDMAVKAELSVEFMLNRHANNEDRESITQFDEVVHRLGGKMTW